MRNALFGLAAFTCLFASPVLAQDTWQYDADGVDGPTASITDGDYTIGGFCDDGTLYFFADFPRTGMPKAEDASIRFKFRKDAPMDQPTFNVSVLTSGWDRFGDLATMWFHGQSANEWIDDMSTAQRNAFIAVETDEETPQLIFEHVFSVRGSTAAIRSLKAACEA